MATSPGPGTRAGTFSHARRRIEPAPLQQVGAVDTAGGDVDDHFAGPGDRVGNFQPAQHLGFAWLGNDDGVHAYLRVFGASLPVVASGSLQAAVTTERNQTCALSIEIWADMTYASYRSVSTPYSPAREEPKGDERD